eukprot:9483550-Pyramimonas_sp.AAC.2
MFLRNRNKSGNAEPQRDVMHPAVRLDRAKLQFAALTTQRTVSTVDKLWGTGRSAPWRAKAPKRKRNFFKF